MSGETASALKKLPKKPPGSLAAERGVLKAGVSGSVGLVGNTELVDGSSVVVLFINKKYF